jgi:hypothetical protein
VETEKRSKRVSGRERREVKEYESPGTVQDGESNCSGEREREDGFLDKSCIYDEIDKGIVISLQIASSFLRRARINREKVI